MSELQLAATATTSEVSTPAQAEVKQESITVTTEVPVKGFIDTLPEDLRTNKTLGKFKDAGELAKSYVNLESVLGKKLQTAPEAYVLPDETKDLITEDVLKVAKKTNISQDQLKEIADILVLNQRSKQTAATKAAEELMATSKKELETEFGIALDKRLDAVKTVLTQYGTEELTADLKESGLLHNTKFVKFLDKITQDVLQVKMVGSDYKAQRALTPAEAQAEIQGKYANKEFSEAYFDPFHPGHKKAVSEMNSLVDQIASA